MSDWATDWRTTTLDAWSEPLPSDRDEPEHLQRRRTVFIWQCINDATETRHAIHATTNQDTGGYDLAWPDGTYLGHIRETATGWFACTATLTSEPDIPTRNAAIGLILSDLG